FAREGCSVVLADVEAGALAESAAAIDGEVLTVVTDVSDAASVENLAAEAFDRFGAVHVVCNNAGVSTFNAIADQTLDDWRWVLGVNLWGVIHGVHAFMPRLLEQGQGGHVVNTASMAGVLPIRGLAGYGVAKMGVVALSEVLALDLEAAGADIGVSA